MTTTTLRVRVALAAFTAAFAIHLDVTPRAAAQQPRAGGLFREVAESLPAAARDDQRAVRARAVGIDFDRLPAARQLILNVFADTSFDAELDRIDRTANGYVWVGHVAGVPLSHVTLSVEGRVMSGSVVTADAAFEIRYAAGEIHTIAQVDQRRYPRELPPLIPAPGAGRAEDVSPGTIAATGPQSDDGSTIDVMVLYTPAVVAARGGDQATRTLVNLGISETNTSYQRSLVTQRLRLVYTGQVSYTESGAMGSPGDLANVTNGAGTLSGVAALRNTHAADMVSLWVHYDQPPSCGVAWLMTSIGAGFAPNAYSVVEHTCVSPNYTFAHELGHNMGARHDWYVDTGTTPRTYAHGFVNVAARWRTIMAYNDQCDDQPTGPFCTRLLNWANPNVMAPSPYPASPMGVPAGTSTSCTFLNPENPPCDADDARLLNETAFTISNFRQAPPAPLAVTALTPSPSSPAPVGTPVTWTATASGGTAPYTYKFLVFDGANWTVGRDWASSNSWTWTPAIAATYSIQVWARNAGSSTIYDAWRQAGFVVTGPPPLAVTALTRSIPSGTPIGPSVQWTATASGGTSPYTFKFLLFDGENWTVGRDWASSNTWSWTPSAPGDYFVQVWARNAGSSALYDAWLDSGSYNVAPPPPLSVTSLTASQPSGVAAGATVVWTAAASGGTGPYTFKFLLFNGSAWSVAQDWSSANTWTWMPSAGTYTVQVWARNAGSSAVYDAWRGSSSFVVTGPAPLDVTSLTSSPPSSAMVSQNVLWTANATGGTGPYTFKFLLFDGNAWSLARDWSSENTWNWSPGSPGSYTVQVWARNAGSSATYDAWRSSTPFSVTSTAPVQITSITPPAGPVTVGAMSTWQVTATGGTAPLQYKFFRYRVETGTWTLAQDYSSSNSFSWTPGAGEQGTYIIQVWVRSNGSSATYEAWQNTNSFAVQ